MTKVKKKDGTLTKAAKEQPRFRTILQYESNFKKSHSLMTKKMIEDITAKAMSLVGK